MVRTVSALSMTTVSDATRLIADISEDAKRKFLVVKREARFAHLLSPEAAVDLEDVQGRCFDTEVIYGPRKAQWIRALKRLMAKLGEPR
jgi:hypothetical protein